MTWDTQLGLRVLQGAEAELYLMALQHTVAYLWDIVELDDDLNIRTGDRIFDSASVEQKIILLHQCLSALLKPEIPAPSLTNIMEAAAFLPFAFLQMRIEEEIEDEMSLPRQEDDDDFTYFYRRLTWNAYDALFLSSQETVDGENDEPFNLDWHSTNVDDWEDAIDHLADLIFYDRDWQMTALRPQLLDGLEKDFSEQTGIYEEYITNRLPKVSSEQVATVLLEIQHWRLH
jgi:hypothetical protein